MIKNKYVISTVITLAVIGGSFALRENYGDRYISCLGRQVINKKHIGEHEHFDSFVTLNLDRNGNGFVIYDGVYIFNNSKYVVDRRYNFTFNQLSSKIFYQLDYKSEHKQPDDNTPDDLFYALSESHKGKIVRGITAMTPRVIVIGDSFSPRLVCVKKMTMPPIG